MDLMLPYLQPNKFAIYYFMEVGTILKSLRLETKDFITCDIIHHEHQHICVGSPCPQVLWGQHRCT